MTYLIRVRPSDFYILLFTVFVGLLLTTVVLLGNTLPLKIGVIFLLVLTLWGIVFVKVTRLSLLPRLMIVLYSLPFSTAIGYLFNKNYTLWSTPLATQYSQDHVLVGHMITVGIIGLSGLLTGIRFSRCFNRQKKQPVLARIPKRVKTLSPLKFLILICIALFFSWIAAPTSDIFTSAYASEGTAGLAAFIRFNSAYLLSYVLLVLLYVDLEQDTVTGKQKKKRWKIKLLISVTIFIVVFLQFLRGDRESIGLIAALMALYITNTSNPNISHLFSSLQRRRIRKLILPASLVIIVAVLLGSARYSLNQSLDFNLWQSFIKGFQGSTWSAVLLTNLSMAAQYTNGTIEYLYGQTYIDYLLSLPPGFLTLPLGIERPLETYHAPAHWFTDISSGGVHIALVPFRNFGALGVFFILILYGFLIGRLELANRTNHFTSRFLYGTVVSTSFFWFWYGDINIIRGLMIAIILRISYSFIVRLQFTRPSTQQITYHQPG